MISNPSCGPPFEALHLRPGKAAAEVAGQAGVQVGEGEADVAGE